MDKIEKQNLYKDLILNGGNSMLNFKDLSKLILSKSKTADDVFNNVVNDLLGGLSKEEENNNNVKELFMTIMNDIKSNSKKQPKKSGGNSNKSSKKVKNPDNMKEMIIRLRDVIVDNM